MKIKKSSKFQLKIFKNEDINYFDAGLNCHSNDSNEHQLEFNAA